MGVRPSRLHRKTVSKKKQNQKPKGKRKKEWKEKEKKGKERGGKGRKGVGVLPASAASIFKHGGRRSLHRREASQQLTQGRQGAGTWSSPHSSSSCSLSCISALASGLSTLRLLASSVLGTLLGNVGNSGLCQKALLRLQNHEKRPGVWNLTVFTCFRTLDPEPAEASGVA